MPMLFIFMVFYLIIYSLCESAVGFLIQKLKINKCK